MSVDPEPRALHVRGEDGDGAYRVDASGALGVQVGEGNTQIIYAYGRQTWADGVVPPPLATVSGVVDSPYRGLNTFEERDAPFFYLTFSALLILAFLTSIFPASLFGVLGGMLFGLVKGFALCSGALLAAALIAFAFARYFFRTASRQLAAKVLDLDRLEARGH